MPQKYRISPTDFCSKSSCLFVFCLLLFPVSPFPAFFHPRKGTCPADEFVVFFFQKGNSLPITSLFQVNPAV